MDKTLRSKSAKFSASVDEEKKRPHLNRTISMGAENISMTHHLKSLSRTPTLLSRWRALRKSEDSDQNLETILDTIDEESGAYAVVMEGESPPSDDIVFFESFDSANGEELRVKIVKDQIRQNIIDLMKSNGGNVHIMEDIENGTVTPEVIVQNFSNVSQLEKNIALLWTSFMTRPDLTAVLLSCGADLNYCEPTEGFSSVHLSAFSGCESTTKFLLAEGANVNYALKCYTPLHSAAFGNSVATAQLLLNSGAHFNLPSQCNNGHCISVIHSAIKANSVDCVRLLVNRCPDINFISPNGTAPIHLAAELGHLNCLQVLLEVKGVDLNLKTRDKKNTALHLAAESGISSCIALLLEKGANPGAGNARGQTALHLAARAQSVECVETLLKTHSCNPNAKDNDKRTPLHSAVARAVSASDITEILISWKADVNVRDKYGYTPLHLAAMNEVSQCVETLIYHGADVTTKTKGGTTALAIIARKIPATLHMLYHKLDNSISLHDPEDTNREVELKLDFRCILQHCQNGEISFLNTFVDEGQKEILEHPLCEAFLHLKWEKIRKYYIGRLLFSGVFVLFLTAYVMCGLVWNCYNVGQGIHLNTTGNLLLSNTTVYNIEQGINLNATVNLCLSNTTVYNVGEGINLNATRNICLSNITVNELLRENMCLSNTTLNEFLRANICLSNTTGKEIIRGNIFIVKVLWYIVVLLAILETIRKLLGLAAHSTLRQYLSQYENIMEWLVVISVFFISCVYTGQTYTWQNHIAAFSVLCAWINLMLKIGQLPRFGSYVAMYTKVQGEFAKLLLAYICMLVGFTFSFCIIFPASESFSNLILGFIKVLVMMTGELDMDLLLKHPDSPLWLEVSAYIIFSLFVLLVTVVLMNLLVGIAVNDIQGLRKTAGLSNLVRQTKLISYIESAIFNGYLPIYVVQLLQWSALVSPSAYRVALHVKPLNPREKRLPKDVLKAAYELARSHRRSGNILSSKGSNVAYSAFYSKLKDKGERKYCLNQMMPVTETEEEIQNLKLDLKKNRKMIKNLSEEVHEIKEMMQNLLEVFNKKPSDI